MPADKAHRPPTRVSTTSFSQTCTLGNRLRSAQGWDFAGTVNLQTSQRILIARPIAYPAPPRGHATFKFSPHCASRLQEGGQSSETRCWILFAQHLCSQTPSSSQEFALKGLIETPRAEQIQKDSRTWQISGLHVVACRILWFQGWIFGTSWSLVLSTALGTL